MSNTMMKSISVRLCLNSDFKTGPKN